MMSAALFLFLLRLASALVLLAFMGSLAWFIYRDMRQTSRALVSGRRAYGYVQVIASGVAVPAGEDPAGGDGLPAVSTRFPLLPVTSIGRAASNSIVLNDGYISNEHALLTLRGQQWWLQDLNSRNGTLLNGIMLSEATVVSPGDVITVGGAQLRLELPHADPAGLDGEENG